MVRQKTVLHFLHTIMAQLYLGHGIVHGIWHEIGHLAVAQPTRLQLGARRGKKLRRQPVSPTRRNQKACVQNLTMNVWPSQNVSLFRALQGNVLPLWAWSCSKNGIREACSTEKCGFLSIVVYLYLFWSIIVIHSRYHWLPQGGAVIGTFWILLRTSYS